MGKRSPPALPEWWGRINPIAAYRAVYGTPTDSAVAALLDRLERDHRMSAAWEMFGRYSRHTNAWSNLIFNILEDYAIARNIQAVPTVRQNLENEYDTLALCAERLAAWFAEFAETPPAVTTIAVGQEIYARSRTLVDSCRWAATFLRELPVPTLKRFDALPNSRKSNNPKITFAVLLTAAFTHNAGQPLDELAAVIADVAFGGNEPLDREVVKVSRHRDRRRHLPGDDSR